MPFRLRNDARKWFKEIQGRLGTAPMFDMYYFCLLAGLVKNRLAEAKDSEAPELVDSFPAEYASKGRLIMSLFISRELKRQGIELSERKAVNAEIGKLVDPNTPSRLSTYGMKLINQYSYGGFEVLSEWFQESPRQIETFLPRYHSFVNEALREG